MLWNISRLHYPTPKTSFSLNKLITNVALNKIHFSLHFYSLTLIDLTFIEYRVAHCHVSLLTVLGTGSDFRKMKSRARFSWYRVSGSDFVKAFKSRSRIFKQGSQRLGESRILPFATPRYVKLLL